MRSRDRLRRSMAPVGELLRRWATNTAEENNVAPMGLLSRLRQRAGRALVSDHRPLSLHEALIQLLRGRWIDREQRLRLRELLTGVKRVALLDQAKQSSSAGSRPGRNRSALLEALALVDGFPKRTRATLAPTGPEALPLDQQQLMSVMADLARIDPMLLEIVELRLIEGHSEQATSQTLAMPTATIKRQAKFARSFLMRELSAVAR